MALKVEHRTIKSTADDDEGNETGTPNAIIPSILKYSDNRRKVSVIRTLLISHIESTAVDISIGFRAVFREGGHHITGTTIEETRNGIAQTRSKLYGGSASSERNKAASIFYIVKDMSIPPGTALDLAGDFINGIPHLSSFELVLILGAADKRVNIVLAYE